MAQKFTCYYCGQPVEKRSVRRGMIQANAVRYVCTSIICQAEFPIRSGRPVVMLGGGDDRHAEPLPEYGQAPDDWGKFNE